MIYLQPLDSQQHLLHLVCFGLSFMVLNIDAGITLPRGFINSMTAPALAGFSKKMIAHFAQIAKPDISGIPLHLCEDIIYISHIHYSIINGIIVKSCFGKYLWSDCLLKTCMGEQLKQPF